LENALYTKEFYKWQQNGSQLSAAATIPFVLNLIQPKSVVDVGCGVGTWLSVFKENGIQNCLGIDGSYVDPNMLMIPPTEFLAHDLKKPILVDRAFDLVVSLEVAEHLPHENAETFIDSLTRLGNAILFSAAIPHQGGSGHINEQWPEYWVELFSQKGYVAIDCLRHMLWDINSVEAWYAQNIFIFIKQTRLDDYAKLKSLLRKDVSKQLSLVHPRTYLRIINWFHKQLKDIKQKYQESLASNAKHHPIDMSLLWRLDKLRQTLVLKEINLIMFPDWHQSDEELLRELSFSINALSSHPDKDKLAILIATTVSIGNDTSILMDRASKLLWQENLNTMGLEVSIISELDGQHWSALMQCLSGRIVLNLDNAQGIAQTHADKLPTWTITTHQP
jgi:cyclopropane fatty-acyl-phospholipid synthase-like methyltransferase